MNLNQQSAIKPILICVSILFILWLQPWESQYEKLADEWASCKNKYNGQCYYIGDKFKTNSLEWAVSGIFHDTYDDEVCVRKRGFRNC
jgi:hypothetical protein